MKISLSICLGASSSHYSDLSYFFRPFSALATGSWKPSCHGTGSSHDFVGCGKNGCQWQMILFPTWPIVAGRSMWQGASKLKMSMKINEFHRVGRASGEISLALYWKTRSLDSEWYSKGVCWCVWQRRFLSSSASFAAAAGCKMLSPACKWQPWHTLGAERNGQCGPWDLQAQCGPYNFIGDFPGLGNRFWSFNIRVRQNLRQTRKKSKDRRQNYAFHKRHGFKHAIWFGAGAVVGFSYTLTGRFFVGKTLEFRARVAQGDLLLGGSSHECNPGREKVGS